MGKQRKKSNKKKKSAPAPKPTGADTAKAWLGLGPQRDLDPWEAFVSAAFAAVIGAGIAWLIFDRTAAIFVLIVGLIIGAIQELRARQRRSS